MISRTKGAYGGFVGRSSGVGTGENQFPEISHAMTAMTLGAKEEIASAAHPASLTGESDHKAIPDLGEDDFSADTPDHLFISSVPGGAGVFAPHSRWFGEVEEALNGQM